MTIPLDAWTFLAKNQREETLAELITTVQLSCLRLAEAIGQFQHALDSDVVLGGEFLAVDPT